MKTTIKGIAVTANILFFLYLISVTAVLIFRFPLAQSLMGAAQYSAEDLVVSPMIWYGIVKAGFFNLILSAAAFSRSISSTVAAIGFWGTILTLALLTVIELPMNFAFTAYMTRVYSVSRISGMSITGSLMGMTSFLSVISMMLIPAGWALIWASSKSTRNAENSK